MLPNFFSGCAVDLHRMLYRDIMAMFLGIHLTVLVVAIPKNLIFDTLVRKRRRRPTRKGMKRQITKKMIELYP